MKVLAELKECPNCKVEVWLMRSIANEEIKKGFMSGGTFGFSKAEVFCNLDLTKPMLAGGRAPGARVFRDICTRCMKEQIVRIETGHVTMPTRQGMLPVFA